MMKYRLAIQLYKIYNANDDKDNWVDLNFQQILNERNNLVHIYDVSKLSNGKNNIMNRFYCINSKIDYDWLNQSLNSFKIKCKMIFLN